MSRLQTNAIRHLGSAVDNLKLDSAGRVLMSNQPAFRATGPVAGDNSSVSFTGKDSAFTGRDSAFNVGTGLFTAPVAGVYLFSFAMMHGNGGSATYARCLFKINGAAATNYGDTLNDWQSQYKFTSMAMAFRLQAGDTVGLLNEGRKIYGPDYGSFSGYLVG